MKTGPYHHLAALVRQKRDEAILHRKAITMQRLDGAVEHLLEEFARSVSIHGMWPGYGPTEVFHAVAGEFEEYRNAYFAQDRHGDHGELAELKQLAVVALKGYILLGGCDLGREE